MDIIPKLTLLSGAATLLTGAGYTSTDGSSYGKTVELDAFRISIRLKDDDSIIAGLSYSKTAASGDTISVYRGLSAAWDGKAFTITGLSDIEAACIQLGSTIN